MKNAYVFVVSQEFWVIYSPTNEPDGCEAVRKDNLGSMNLGIFMMISARCKAASSA